MRLLELDGMEILCKGVLDQQIQWVEGLVFLPFDWLHYNGLKLCLDRKDEQLSMKCEQFSGPGIALIFLILRAKLIKLR